MSKGKNKTKSIVNDLDNIPIGYPLSTSNSNKLIFHSGYLSCNMPTWHWYNNLEIPFSMMKILLSDLAFHSRVILLSVSQY